MESGYRPQLDGLRACAVTAVLVCRFWQPRHWPLALDFGFVGVRLFFVLSGFLITRMTSHQLTGCADSGPAGV